MAVGTLSSNAFGLHAINPAMSIPLMEGYEKASSTFKDGAILKRDTGTLAVAGADNTAGDFVLFGFGHVAADDLPALDLGLVDPVADI